MGLIELTILAGALAGGFVSGLTGFGTGISALAIWLTAVEPVTFVGSILSRPSGSLQPRYRPT